MASVTLVLLKYKILTPDTSTWHLCETYPKEVQVKWAWRCAADCEHLAKGYPEAEECIEVAKRYRDGLTTEEELVAAISATTSPTTRNAARYAALAAARAALNAAYYAAYYAASAVASARSSKVRAEKWDLYINWLIEELCAWEENEH